MALHKYPIVYVKDDVISLGICDWIEYPNDPDRLPRLNFRSLTDKGMAELPLFQTVDHETQSDSPEAGSQQKQSLRDVLFPQGEERG